MSDKDNGGPAFPIFGSYGTPYEHNGMTMRDWFAGQALNMAWQAYADGYYETDSPSRDMARHAYQIADAMLAARNAK